MSFLKKLFGIKDRELTEGELLWEALEKNPNVEPILQRFESGVREHGGEAAGIAALERVARIKGSWRAQLWLGQHAMYAKQPKRALEMFRACLTTVSRPVPLDVLADISATLGSAGHFREVVELVGPAFDARIHTIHVGSNLIRAHNELGQLDQARQILDQLYIVRRPQDEKQLKYWRDALATTETS